MKSNKGCIFLACLLIAQGLQQSTVAELSDRSVDMIEEPEEIPLVNLTAQNHQGNTCVNFIEILIDHMILRVVHTLKDPIDLGNMSSTFFELTDPRLYGLRGMKRMCRLKMEHEELWQKANDNQPNSDITLQDWMKKRDEKLGDIMNFTFCLGLPESVRLHGIMLVYSLWTTYGPEPVVISLSDISIRAQLTLQLNKTGKAALRLTGMTVERLERIQLENDKSATGPVENEEGKSQDGLISSYGSVVNWLVNNPLYMPLVITLENVLKDSFSALIDKSLDSW